MPNPGLTAETIAADRLARAARGYADAQRRGDTRRARAHLRSAIHAAVDVLLESAVDGGGEAAEGGA